MKLDVENLPPDLRGEDINVQYLDMDYGVAEQISRNCDGSYTVFLNARYSYERWVDSVIHSPQGAQNPRCSPACLWIC